MTQTWKRRPPRVHRGILVPVFLSRAHAFGFGVCARGAGTRFRKRKEGLLLGIALVRKRRQRSPAVTLRSSFRDFAIEKIRNVVVDAPRDVPFDRPPRSLFPPANLFPRYQSHEYQSRISIGIPPLPLPRPCPDEIGFRRSASAPTFRSISP